MWKEIESVVGYSRFVAKLWIFTGPVSSAKITISDWKCERTDEFQFCLGDRPSITGLFTNIKEVCSQNDSNGWTVMLSLHKSAMAMAEAKSKEEIILDAIDEDLAAATESQIESYGRF